MSVEENPLKYYRTNELRQEICAMAGVDPGVRFVEGERRGLRKQHLLAVAHRIGLKADGDLTLREIYNLVCGEAGVEYNENAGKQWGLGRDQLKAIHRLLQSRIGANQPLQHTDCCREEGER